jgi:hypothetical protein
MVLESLPKPLNVTMVLLLRMCFSNASKWARCQTLPQHCCRLSGKMIDYLQESLTGLIST